MSKKTEHREEYKRVKLEDISRDNIFQVPNDYFRDLPGIIQSRATERAVSKWWQEYLTPATGWKVALATAVLALVLVFSGIFNEKSTNSSVDEMLAAVSLEDLIEYVEYSEITTDEILAEVDFSDYDMDFLMGDEIHLLNDDEFEDLEAIDFYEEYGLEEELF